MLLSALVCLLSSIILELLPCVLGFNLEPRLPIMKRGEANSYFGYSVAEHLSLNELTGNVKDRWLLVGAPRGQNLQPGTNHSGAIYKCPLTTYSDDCEQVLTDGKRDPITGEYDDTITQDKIHQPDYNSEIKDGQWLGVNVRSQGPGKQVLVCGHRYINKGVDYHWGQGLCYTLGQDLEWHDKWEPCKGRPTKRAHEQWGVCQAGTSAILMDDETALIGSPGAYTWKGTFFALNVSTDYLTRDKTVYYAPVLDGKSPVDKYSYLGFSVTAGRFLGDHMSYVAGAPRSEGVGEVYFFRKVTKSAPFKSILELELTLKGEVFASSYGYELTSADLNGDSIPDLIVGAPFYYSRNKGGAIYVYMNSKEGWMENSEFIRVEGKPESRFGFALANLGDLNNDGYEDLAVGAPYEDNGCVYIYLGAKSGFRPEPMQILRSEQLPWPHPKTFGYSLSGGTDVDGNGYPDLLVGAYSEDKVYLIRSRPVLEITTRFDPIDNISNIDPSGRGCLKDPSSPHVCFSFKTCFKMQTPEKDIKIAYRIEAETSSGKKFSRVRFEDGLPDRSNIRARDISFRDANSKEYTCFDETVYLKEGVQDIQTPIDFKLTYRLVQDEPPPYYEGGAIPDLGRYPILNQQEAIKIYQAQFHKDCGDNDICESDIFIESSLNLQTGNDGYWTLNLGEHEEVVLNVNIKNLGEAAYSAALFVHHPPSVTFTGRSKETETGQYDCTQINSTLVKCHLGNPFKHGEGEVRLRFNPKGLEDNIGQIEFKVYSNTTSHDLRNQEPVTLLAQVVKRAELTLTSSSRPEDLFFGGEVVGDSALEYIDQIGVEVVHVYDVLNHGPWRVNRLVVDVDWPYEIDSDDENGKRVLYLTDIPYIVGGAQCEVEPGQVNYLGLRRRPGSEPASYVYTPSTYDAKLNTGRISLSTSSSSDYTESSAGVAQAVTSRTLDGKEEKKGKKKQTSYKKTVVHKKTSYVDGDDEYSTETFQRAHETGPRVSIEDHNTGGFVTSSIDQGRPGGEVRWKQTVNRESFGEDGSIGGAQSSGTMDQEKSWTETRKVIHSERGNSGTATDGEGWTWDTSRKEWTRVLDPSNTLEGREDGSVENREEYRRRDGVEDGGSRNGWSEYRPYSVNYSRTVTRTDLESPVKINREENFETQTRGAQHFDGKRKNNRYETSTFDLDKDGDFGQQGKTYPDGYDREFDENKGRTVSYRRRQGQTFRNSEGQDIVRGGQGLSNREGSEFGRESEGEDFERGRQSFREGDGQDLGRSRQRLRESGGQDLGRSRQRFRESDGQDLGRSRQRFEGSDGQDLGRSRQRFEESDGQDLGRSRQRLEESDGQDLGRSRQRFEESGGQNLGRSGQRFEESDGKDLGRSRQRFEESDGQDLGHSRQRFEESDGQDLGRSRQRFEESDGQDLGRSRQRFEKSDGQDLGRSRQSFKEGDGQDSGSWRQSFKESDGQDSGSWRQSFREGEGQEFGRRSQSSGGRAKSQRFDVKSNSQEFDSGRDGAAERVTSSGRRDFTREHERVETQRHYSGNLEPHLDGSRLKDLKVGGDFNQEGGLGLEGFDVNVDTGGRSTHQVRHGGFHRISQRGEESVDGADTADLREELRSRSRQRRRVQQIIQPEVFKDSEGRKMKKIVIACGQNARCERFSCVIRNLLSNQSATIRIAARLRNSTFVEDYSAIDQIHIASRASIRVLDTFFQQYDIDDDRAEAVTVAQPDRVFSRTEGKTVPIWIIIVSVIAGVLLLVIISLILWCLGFFKRKRPAVNANGDAEHEKLNGK